MAITKPTILETDIWSRLADPSDKTKPTQNEIDSGFAFGQKPTHQSHNWLFETMMQFVAHLNQYGVPAWDATTVYTVGALTNDGGELYQALTENSNIQPSMDDGTNWVRWDPTTQLPEIGGMAWDAARGYIAGTLVTHSGDIWNALQDNTGVEPGTDPATWRAVQDYVPVPTLGGETPIGGIIMYSGALADLPANWRLCNGDNGTPDLRDRFVLGAGSDSEIGQVGGSADAVVVEHNHIFTGIEMPEHNHDGYIRTDTGQAGSRGLGTMQSEPTASPRQNANVAASAGTPEGSISTEGVSGVGKNMPPYYKLAYIIRVS